jgi:hypothetical protein
MCFNILCLLCLLCLFILLILILLFEKVFKYWLLVFCMFFYMVVNLNQYY